MDLIQIQRINELYHKSQKEGLTEEEKEEQKKLRADYIAAIRKNMRGTLDQVSFVNPDGSYTRAKDLRDMNMEKGSESMDQNEEGKL